MITAINLTKRYGKNEVLRGLSLAAEPGKVTLLIGSNGAGKTTTLRILSGLAKPDGGDAKIGGRSIVSERKAAQMNFSFLPQQVAFHPRLTCRQVIDFYASLRNVSKERAGSMIERVGLSEVEKKRTGVLSGGLRQRLGLAVLLLPDAPVLMLDEPGLSLDPEWRERLKELLQDEARRGRTVLVTTHLLAEWEGAADRCLLCHEGRVSREVDPNRLREAFASVAPARLLAA